jgi:hypothetical protein
MPRLGTPLGRSRHRALPNPDSYNVLDPTDSATFSTSHWAAPDECSNEHLHGTFQGHGDPDTAGGHGGLVFIVTQQQEHLLHYFSLCREVVNAPF